MGLSPTYLSSTTSRAKSSRSAGSSIAAPPYLMTTVGVSAVQRGLDRGGVGAGPRGGLGGGQGPAAGDDAADPVRALAIGDDHDRQRTQQLDERFGQAPLILPVRGHPHAALSRAH